MTKDLVKLSTSVIGKEMTLAELKAEIKALPTAQLANGYENLKPYEKTIAEIVKTARDEIMTRFPDEKTSSDEKGHWYIEVEGTKLQARLSTKFALDEDKAREVLADKGLLGQAIDHTIKASNLASIKSGLEAIESDLRAVDSALADRVGHVLSLFVTEEKLSEDKIKALASLGSLSAEELESIYEDKSSRALYIMKK